MRTSITKQELRTYPFKMTDQDVLSRVDELNRLKGQEADLDRKKKTVQAEMKSLQTEMEQMFNNIARREEEREVECDVTFDYKTRMVEVFFEGEELASNKMSEWQYSDRPVDIYPAVKSKVEEHIDNTPTSKLADAVLRAEEIAEKEKNNIAPSANVHAFSEAKTETTINGGVNV